MSKERSLRQLIDEFEAKAGNFGAFHREMTPKEKKAFKGWLQDMRAPKPKTP